MQFNFLYLLKERMSISKWTKKIRTLFSKSLPFSSFFLSAFSHPHASNPPTFDRLVPHDAWLVMDKNNEADDVPKNFRLCTTQYDFHKILQFYKYSSHLPTRFGMDILRCSGSAQFSLSSLLNIMRLTEKPLVVFDLRLEPHFFNEGHAISFFLQGSNNFYHSNYSDTWAQTEEGLLNLLKAEPQLTVNIILAKHAKVIQKASQLVLPKGNLLTEEELLKQYNVKYVRLPVLDSNLPHDKVVDQFIEAVQHLPQDSWIHFHCRGGKGRTSLFMTLYDMYRNAFHVAFEDIIRRQAFIGPSNIHEYPAVRRTRTLTFLKAFYEYVRDPKGLNHQPWSVWHKKKVNSQQLFNPENNTLLRSHNPSREEDKEALLTRYQTKLAKMKELALPLQEEKALLNQLLEFELGRFLLQHQGLNGYWTAYIILTAPYQSNLHPLEEWLVKSAPASKATRERFHIFKHSLQKHLKKGMTIASIPCGLMDDLLSLNYSEIKDVKLVGIDLDDDGLQLAQENAGKYPFLKQVEFLKKDAWNLNEHEKYDIITSNGLNIYEADDEKIIALYKEFHKALKAGGILITSFLTPSPMLSSDSTWKNHKLEDVIKQKAIFTDILEVKWQTFKTPRQATDLLEKAGFKIQEIIYDSQGMFPTIIVQKEARTI